MKKILFVHHASGWGGAPIAMIKLIKALDVTKYDVRVLLLKDSIVSKKLEENGIKYSIAESLFFQRFYFGFIHSEASYYKWYQFYYLFKSILFWLLARYYFIGKELSKHDFDIIHLNSSIMSDWLAPARQRGEVVIHIREPFRKGKFDIIGKYFIGQMQKYASQIIAISEDNSKRIGLPHKTQVIYDYCELATNAPKLDSYSSKCVLYLGGSAPIKGFCEIVESLKYLDQDVKIYFGGSYDINNSSNLLTRLVNYFKGRNKKLEKTINLMRSHINAVEIGLVYDVTRYLNEVCCLVSPFAKPHFSLPVIEAFANYKPVIVTNVEGADEVVLHGLYGLIVEKSDPKELAEAINFICKNANIAQQMGQNGHKEAEEKYSISNMNKVAAIYDRLLQKFDN